MKRDRHVRWWVRATLLTGALFAGAVWAQPAGSGATGTSGASGAAVPGGGKKVCVNAEINGVKALSYDCLSQQLAPTPTATPGSSENPAEALATAPSNKVGTFNYSAESIRFGNAWGNSVTPQRPAPTPAVPVK
ncbi:MAG TPA: hypothetical protein VGL08_15165 [Paraburkholderia sp.]